MGIVFVGHTDNKGNGQWHCGREYSGEFLVFVASYKDMDEKDKTKGVISSRLKRNCINVSQDPGQATHTHFWRFGCKMFNRTIICTNVKKTTI